MPIMSYEAKPTRDSISTIAELVYIDAPAMNFSRLVSHLDRVLLRFHPNDRTLAWDCDDVAIFDVPGTRIALAYTDMPRFGVAACLLISVGPSPICLDKAPEHARPVRAAVRHDALCSRLVERVQARLEPDLVCWQEINEPVTFDLIDRLSKPRPQPSAKAIAKAMPVQPSFDDASQRTDAVAQPIDLNQAHIRPEIWAGQDKDLMRLRSALYPTATDQTPQVTSTQLRLATHAMNATLIAASLPIGAALTTYALLRGENMRTTTSAMVLTGLAGTLLHGKLAEQLMFLGII